MNTTNFRNTLAAAGSGAQYDSDVKKILARKSILARILEAVVDEFNGEDPEKIEGLIDDNIMISRIPVESDLTNLKKDTEAGGRIDGFNTEAPELDEGTAVFDIIFYVRSKNSVSQIIINIEILKCEPSEYNILDRAIFYESNMISLQKERDFTGMNYDDLKRAFSIWVCMNMEECIWNEVYFENNSVLDDHERNGEPSLFNIVLLGMPKEIPGQEEKYALHRMISVLLSPDLAADKKMEILENEYQIKDDKELRKELNEMCNLSEGIYEEGVREGIHENSVRTAKVLIDMKKISFQEIARATGLTFEEVEKLANLQPA